MSELNKKAKSKASPVAKVFFFIGIGLLAIGLIYSIIHYKNGEFYKNLGWGYGLWIPYTNEKYGISYFSMMNSAILFERDILIAIFLYAGVISLIVSLIVFLATRNKKEKAPAMQVSNADELAKFKALLDSGAISQEEFDAKKQQLLGL